MQLLIHCEVEKNKCKAEDMYKVDYFNLWSFDYFFLNPRSICSLLAYVLSLIKTWILIYPIALKCCRRVPLEEFNWSNEMDDDGEKSNAKWVTLSALWTWKDRIGSMVWVLSSDFRIGLRDTKVIFVSFSVDGMKKESKTSFNSLPIKLWHGIPLNFAKAPFACMIVKDLFASTIIL